MKIHKLKISGIRGITDTVEFDLNGRNFCIWGPNGAGKSAVVDALDFLLTGEITRLTGTGTRGLSLSNHGVHIDYENATVEAEVQLSNGAPFIKLKRETEQHDNIIIENGEGSDIRELLKLTDNGIHLLMRKEILDFITVEPKRRAEQIQNLLNINDIEIVRSNLVKTKNSLKRKDENALADLEKTRQAIVNLIGTREFTEEGILKFANDNRDILNRKPIENLRNGSVLSGIEKRETKRAGIPFDASRLEINIKELQRLLTDKNTNELLEKNEVIIKTFEILNREIDVIKDYRSIELIDLGLSFLDDSGDCPLCGTAWGEGELETYLKTRLENVKGVRNYYKRIKSSSEDIKNKLIKIKSLLEDIKEAAKQIGATDSFKTLEDWEKNINSLIIEYSAILEIYDEKEHSNERLASRTRPVIADNFFTKLLEEANLKFVKPSDQEIAFKNLYSLDLRLKDYDSALVRYDKSKIARFRSETLLVSYEKQRDTVLASIYEGIKQRFTELYRALHDIDESEFESELRPDGAGMRFEVDFYGRGKYPPNALHSEGHQDSMGICLFLALSEYLSRGAFNLVILDDVVMSVDEGHRKKLCGIFKNHFSNKQLIITTHNKVWAKQLKAERVVESSNFKEFVNWDIDNGPQIRGVVDSWQSIYETVENNDISIAASKLRRSMEEYFEKLCSNLSSEIPYNTECRWDFGQYFRSAVSTYKDLIKAGVGVANSWDDDNATQELRNIDSQRKQLLKGINYEQWAINPALHFNNWGNFVKEDFYPVVEAFENLCSHFICSNCGMMIYLVKDGLKNDSVRCDCESIKWNLRKK